MIDKANGNLPVYKQIQEWIRKKVEDGHWPEHYKLPSEDSLAIQFNVARGTIRQALQEMVDHGVIYRLRGKGTFVASGQIEHCIEGEFLSFLEELVKKKVSFHAKILDTCVAIAQTPTASYLGIDEKNDKVFRLRRLREIGDNSLMLSENNVVHALFPGIEDVDFNEQSLYSALETQWGIRIAWAKRIFEAQIATGEIARLLKVPDGTPLMFVEQLVYDDQGRCVDCAYLWLHANYFKLTVTLNRNQRRMCYGHQVTK